MGLSRQLASVLLAVALHGSGGCSLGDVVLGERGQTQDDRTQNSGTSSDDVGAQLDAGATVPVLNTAADGGSGAPIVTVTGSSAAQRDAGGPAQPSDAGKPDAHVPSIGRASAGCGKDPVSPRAKVSVNGVSADYLLDVPAPYERARGYALVLAFRGMDRTASQFRDQLQLSSATGSAAIIAYANPLSGGANWDFSRDMPLVDGLIATLGDSYCVDLDRVFAIGGSDGALFVNLVGCMRAEQVRAIAALSSAPPPPGPCRDNPAVWLMQQSDAEPMTVGIGLGNRDFWAARNGCDVYALPPVSPAGCMAYPDCNAGLPVHYCEYQGATLPSTAVATAWDFFRSL